MIHDKYYELSLVCYTYKPYVKLWLLADVSLMPNEPPLRATSAVFGLGSDISNF